MRNALKAWVVACLMATAAHGEAVNPPPPTASSGTVLLCQDGILHCFVAGYGDYTAPTYVLAFPGFDYLGQPTLVLYFTEFDFFGTWDWSDWYEWYSPYSPCYLIPDGEVHPITLEGQETGGESFLWYRKLCVSYTATTNEITVFGADAKVTCKSVDASPAVKPKYVDGQKRGSPTENTIDPVNLVSGDMAYERTDIAIPCPGMPLSFTRYYSSGATNPAALGPRWRHSYDMQLVSGSEVIEATDHNTQETVHMTNKWMDIRLGSGETKRMPQAGSNLWCASDAEVSRWFLVSNASGYDLRLPGDALCQFDTNGLLVRMADLWSNSVSLVYTNSGSTSLLSRVEHTNGQYLAFTYQTGLITRIDTPVSNFYVTAAYGPDGDLTNVTRHTSSGSFPTSYSYDTSTNHSLTQIVNPRGDIYAYAYATNATGQTTSRCIGMVLNTNWYEHSVSYNTNASCSTVTYYRGDTNLTSDYHYDPYLMRTVRIVGPNLQSLTNRMDYAPVTGYLTNEVVSDSESGQFVQATYLYDYAGNVTNEAFGFGVPPSNFWSYGWNTANRLNVLTNIVDPEGVNIEYEYTNAVPWKVRQHNGSGSFDTVLGLSSNGLVAAVTNANGNWVKYFRNQYGFATSSVPRLGPTTFATFSRLGQLEKVQYPAMSNGAPCLASTTFDVDEEGRVHSVAFPDGTSNAFLFDAMGNVTNFVDAAGRTNVFAWLPERRLQSFSRIISGTNYTILRNEYDKQFNTLTIRDALDRPVEKYQLDEQDRPHSILNVESQEMSVVYGVGEYVRQITRFDGTVVSNAYGEDGQLGSATYPGTTNTFTYLKNGLLSTATNPEGTVSNAYSINRLVLSSSPAPSGTVVYSYHPAGQVSNVTSIAGTTTYILDAGDRLSAIDSSAGTFSFTYNTNSGTLDGMTVTNTGFHVEYQHDIMGRRTNIIWRNSSSNVVRRFQYQFDWLGQVSKVTREDGGSVSYGYDGLDRLISETHADSSSNVLRSESISYDLAGNRTSKTRDGVSIDYTLGSGNRLSGWKVTNTNLVVTVDVEGHANETIGTGLHFGSLWVSNKVAVTPETDGTNFWVAGLPMNQGTQQVVAAICDAAGNTIRVTNTVYMTVVTNGSYLYNDAGCVTNIQYSGAQYSQRLSLEWDGQYRLSKAYTNGVLAEGHGYDAYGRRLWSTESGETNWFVYDGAQVVADLDATGKVLRSYVWGPGIDNLIAMRVHTGAVTKTYYALTDHLGTVHALAEESGVVVESYQFDAWGRVLGVYDGAGTPLAQSAIGNRYLWQGREYSWDTGLYYFRARWYDPVIGRWLSNDPIGIAGGLNEYVAFGSNPVNFVDPFGLCRQNEESTRQLFGNALNNTCDAIGRVMFDGPSPAWDMIGEKSFNEKLLTEDKLLQINELMWSTKPPETPEATPYVEEGLKISAEAVMIALAAGTYEFLTGIRFEFHGTHGGTVLPHIQNIRGKALTFARTRGWTRWRWPEH